MKTSFLIIKKSEFKSQLEKRISIGEEIHSRIVTTSPELEKFIDDSVNWHDYNLEYLKQSFDTPTNEYWSDYSSAGYTYMGDVITNNPNNPLLLKKDMIKHRIDNLKRLNNKAELFKSSEPESEVINEKMNNQMLSKNEVFIVHGHDDSAKTQTARFVEKLGFKPIILHEQASSGKTIIEKIEEYSNVGFGIVLYTPCDVGSVKNSKDNLQNRARQNVVFEHGYLIGKIGRNNVCALVKGEIEKPNDISGVVFVKMDDDEAWNLKLAKELRNSGYDVDLNKL